MGCHSSVLVKPSRRGREMVPNGKAMANENVEYRKMPVIKEENDSVYEDMTRKKSKLSVEIMFIDGPGYSKSKGIQNVIQERLFSPNYKRSR